MKLTVVGPERIYTERKNVSIGDVLTCKKKYSSEYGKTVEVYNKNNVQIGFIAARLETAERGTELADEIYNNVKVPTEFKIEVEKIVGNKFVCKKKEEIKMENVNVNVNEAKVYKNCKINVAGAKKIYAHRFIPLKIMKDNPGTNVKARMVIVHDNRTNKSSKEEDVTYNNYNIEDGIVTVTKTNVGTDEVHTAAKATLQDVVDSVNNPEILVQFLHEGEWKSCGHIARDTKAEDGYESEDVLRKAIIDRAVDGKMPEIECWIVPAEGPSTAPKVILSAKIFGETEGEKLMAEHKKDFDSDAFDKIQKFLADFNLSDEVRVKFLDVAKSNIEQDAGRIPKETIFKNYDEVMEDVIYSIVSGANTMLVGPMAAGKNTCLETLAHVAGKALYEVQVNSYIDNDVLLGTRTIVARDTIENKEEVNKQGRLLIEALAQCFSGRERTQLKEDIENNDISAVETIQAVSGLDFSVLLAAMKDNQTEVSFQLGVIPTAMERGSWVVVDEFNAGPAGVMALLNSVMDARRRIQVPGYGLVHAAPGFRLFGTMNPGYAGTDVLNPATASRFVHVKFKAAENISEIIKSRVPNAPKDFLKEADKLYNEIKKSIEQDKMQEDSMNVRGFIEAAKQVVNGRSIKRALISCVVNGVADETDHAALASFVELRIA